MAVSGFGFLNFKRDRVRCLDRYVRRCCRQKVKHGGREELWLQRSLEGVHRGFCALKRPLPVDRESGFPAVFVLCRIFCRQQKGDISLPEVSRWLEAEQLGEKLLIRELQALPSFLQAALLELCAQSGSTASAAEESLRRFLNGEEDYGALLWRFHPACRRLLQDGTVAAMTEESRRIYLERVEAWAAAKGISEEEAVSQAFEKAGGAHVGTVLLQSRKSFLGRLVLCEVALTLLFTAVVCAFCGFWGLSALLPLWEFSAFLCRRLAGRSLTARELPALDFSNGVPEKEATLCVITSLLQEEDGAIFKRLEQLYLQNREGALAFGILADFPDSPHPDGASQRKCIQKAKEQVRRLNERYGERFYLFVRPRVYDPADGVYRGFERKRGAVLALLRLIGGQGNDFATVEGLKERLSSFRFLMTLDRDTEPEWGAVSALVGVLAHPLNAPCLRDGRVVSGYGLLQPACAPTLLPEDASSFCRIAVGGGGGEAYHGGQRDSWWEATGESLFCGKGLMHVQAMLACASRLPNGKILSHDILEGGLVRTAFAGNTVFYESFPGNVFSFFKREDRWIRGDWQNAPFLKERALSLATRWCLLANLRRSLVSPAVLACVLAAAFLPRPAAGWLLAGGCCGWLFTLLTQIRRCFFGKRRFFFAVKRGTVRTLQMLGLEALWLPLRAWAALRAVGLALWRMVRGKKRLAWTTAAQGETGCRSDTLKAYRCFWPSLIPSLVLLCAPSAWAWGVALIWLAGPWAAAVLSLAGSDPHGHLSARERARLVRYARDTWRYFEGEVNASTRYLPPDNVQFSPHAGVALRTSPTNIGLYLCSLLAAHDFGFIDTPSFCAMAEKSLNSIEQLPSFRGHLYNWYSLPEGKVLSPAYISSVDSGNLAVSLLAFAAGAEQIGGARLEQIAARCRILCRRMDFSLLYRKKRGLFSVGYRVDGDVLEEPCYDLYMSEARLTGYLAVALGTVPPSHWHRLSRPLAGKDGYTGMRSWSGTAFEYLMPRLFLPAPAGSFGAESLHFCVYCQQKRRFHGVWGTSEGGCFSFNGELHYRYRAFGTPELSSCGGMERERIVMPYASFLALPIAPKRVMENLRKLEKLGAYGAYGFYEALDMTPPRTGGGMAVVESCMAHHAGMSLIAAANACFEDVFVKRTLSLPEMGAAIPLLRERIPTDGVVARLPSASLTEKPGPVRSGGGPACLCQGYDPAAPRVHLITNGKMTALCSDGGHVSLSAGKTALLRFDPLGMRGLWTAFYTKEGAFFPTPLPVSDARVEYRSAFSGSSAVYTCTLPGERALAETKLTVLKKETAIALELRVKRRRPKDAAAEGLIFLEPLLCLQQEDRAHPAFAGLFMECRVKQGVLLVHRRRRSPDTEDRWMALFAAEKGRAFDFVCAREDLFPFAGSMKDLLTAFGRIAGRQSTQTMTDAALGVRVSLPADGKAVRFYVAYGHSEEELLACAERLQGGEVETSDYVAGLLGREEYEKNSRLLSALVFPPKIRENRHDPFAEDTLWKCGVGGDRPLLLYRAETEGQAEGLKEEMKQLSLLHRLSVPFEAVVLTKDVALYERPVSRAVQRMVATLEDELPWVKILPLDTVEEESLALMELLAVNREGEPFPKPVQESQVRVSPLERAPLVCCENGLRVWGGCFDGESFWVDNGMPERPWCHVLTNGSFGTLVGHRSAGFTFISNAGECRLTPWQNDVRFDQRGEHLLLRRANGKTVDVLACASTCRFSPGEARWETQDKGFFSLVTARIMGKEACKELQLHMENRGEGEMRLELEWRVQPVLGKQPCPRELGFDRGDGMLFVRRLRKTESCRWGLALFADRPCETETENGWAVLRFQLTLAPGQSEEFCVYTGAAPDTERADLLRKRVLRQVPLLRVQNLTFAKAMLPQQRIVTPDPRFDVMANVWLPYQNLSARIFGRTGFYQAGGAYGFRDQLQDSLNALTFRPDLTRRQLLRSARHQFEEGDVLHWWHSFQAKGGLITRGIRTRCGDDLLWLPYVLACYVEQTGDKEILQVSVRYKFAPPLAKGVDEHYGRVEDSPLKEPLWQHALKAALHAYRPGPRGLLNFGSGDWNDGMNRVKGESVWLSQFALMVYRRFAKTLSLCGKQEEGAHLLSLADALQQAVETHGFNGCFYLRGYYADGTPLGDGGGDACHIDVLTQAFSVFAGLNEERCRSALLEAYSQLVDEKHGLIRLLNPPFDRGRDAGYINGYLPGVRENGGQYTHAAVWFALAMLSFGFYEKGFRLLEYLLPGGLSRTGEQARWYGTEPYALCGDICSASGLAGRGGWSLYTGAAGWMFTAILRGLLGLENGRITPRIPAHWEGYTLKQADGTQRYIARNGTQS